MSKDEALKLASALDDWATQMDMGRKPDPKSLTRKASAELRRLQAELDTIKQALAEPVQELDWSDSKTLPTELWKNRMYSTSDRLLMADGAVAFEREVNANLRKQLTAPKVPEIDYDALIAASFKTNQRWAQGTNGCVAFKHGAEWFRMVVLESTPPVAQSSQEPLFVELIAQHPGLAEELKAIDEQPLLTPEPCGWQFYQDGKWHNGMETNNHRKNTEDAGFPVRDVYPSPQQVPMSLEEYDAGLLSDYGGGNVEWWQDYIRSELSRAYDYYQAQL